MMPLRRERHSFEELDGFDVQAGRSRTVREDGRVVRRSKGNLPHRVVAGFPGAMREHLGTADVYYRSDGSPFEGAA